MQNETDLTQRVSAPIELVNVRIARLASALHVALDDSAALSALMASPPTPSVEHERRTTSIELDTGSEHRQSHLRDELRGLLMLRAHMEACSLKDNGLAVTHQALAMAEAHMLRRGFKPGADGLSLDGFFSGK